MFKVTLPIYIWLPRKTKKDKKIAINLNTYRNLHFIVENQSKRLFKELIHSDLIGVKFTKPITIHYEIFVASARLSDIDNVGSIVSKYFQDAIVECGLIEDDNYLWIKKIEFEFGGIDRDNPRAIATITEYIPKNDEVIQDELF